MIALASVDFPEPLGPIRAWISPWPTVRSSPRRISFSPALTWRFRISSSAMFNFLVLSYRFSSGSADGGWLDRGALSVGRELDQRGERRGLKRADDSPLHARPEQLRRAAPA